MKLNKTGIWLGGGVGLLLTIVVTFSSFQYLNQIERNKFQEQTAHVEQEFGNYLDNIKENIRFTATTLNLSQDRQGVQLATGYADVVVYAPMLRHPQRREFVERMREDGFINFEIINGNKPSLIHPAYLPVTRIEPFSVRYISLLGVDLLNREGIRQSIISASVSGDISMVKAKVIGKKSHYWMFKAIYSGLAGQRDPYFLTHKMEMLNGIIGFQLTFPDLLTSGMLASGMYATLSLEDAGASHTILQQSGDSLLALHLFKQLIYPVDSAHYLKLNIKKTVPWSDQMVWILLLIATVGMVITWLLMASSQAVIRSDLRKQNILESAFEGILSFNAQAEIWDCNPAANMILSSMGTVGEQKLYEIFNFIQFDAGKGSNFGAFLLASREDLLNKPIELTAQAHDGTHFIECSISYFEERSSVHFTMFLRDITVRKKNDEERSKLAVIVEQSFNAIILTDCDGVIDYVNPAFEKMSGFSSAEAVGKTPSITKSGQHSRSYYQEMWKTLAQGQSWKGNFINKAKDGHLYEVEQTIFPIFPKNSQKAIGYTAIQQDVTERNRIQKKDEHAQRLESLGVLAGGIAHDFNNLLTAIMGNASLAKNDLENTDACRDKLDNILNASESAANLCKQMLAYSGKGQFIIHPMNLSEVIQKILQLLKTSVLKNAKLIPDLRDDLPLVEADEGQMQQVIMNLVINAAEAMGESAGEIQVITETVYLTEEKLCTLLNGESIAKGDYVVIHVRDNGCGMDADTQKKVFDPFFTTKFTGRGLGMSAILGIVRAHKGALQMQSVVGQGTQFSIYFPVVKGSHVTTKTHISNSTMGSDTPLPTSTTVLIVDDEKDIRSLASNILDMMDMHSIQAESGEQGLVLLEEHLNEIDVVLLDMTMPNMNGQEFYVKMQDFASHIPVIISSGYAESDIRQRFEKEHSLNNNLAIAFLQKPYHPETLKQSVQDILKDASKK
ncbi:PAS domain S-box protein [Mariprofundus ferrooxydans]|nr:PAS domain S-box protein [Mariprofundus ferrooxydans]